MSRQGILAGGNFITDYVKIVDCWPDQDTLASIRSESMSNGGGPYNILKNVAALAPHLPREACGLIGTDANGDWVVNDCLKAGIDIRQLHRTDAAATSYTDAMTVASTGRRTFFHQRGANALLAPKHFDFTITNAKVFMLGYLMLLDSLDVIDGDGITGEATVLRAAREAGLVTSVDCVSKSGDHFRQVVLAALAEADLVFLNEFEIGQVLGREVPVERHAMEDASLELAQKAGRTNTRVVLHAVAGAVVAQADGSIVTHPSVDLPESEIAGATGAGDAFASGFLLAVHEELDSAECLHHAVCCAAMSLCNATPSGGMRPLDTCLGLAESHGFRHF